MIGAGSFQGTRTRTGVRRMAADCTIDHIASSAIRPCCWSIQSQSQPAALMTSAVSALGTMHHATVGDATLGDDLAQTAS